MSGKSVSQTSPEKGSDNRDLRRLRHDGSGTIKNLRIARMILLSAGLLLFQRTAAAQAVTTLAGSGAEGSMDGTGAEASFFRPSGLAVDSSFNVYVADSGNNKIRKITPSGRVTTLAGSGVRGGADGHGTAATFRYPVSVAVDASGNVYVTEQSYWSAFGGGDADIRKISPDGEVTTVVALPSVFAASSVAVDGFGNLFIADEGDYGDGLVGKILRITPDGNVTTVVKLPSPKGVAIGSQGELYISDSDTGDITKISAGEPSTVLAHFDPPPGRLAVDGSGNVYVAETSSHTIRRVATDGSVATVAGSGLPGDSDGTGTAASFHFPLGVALDSSGNLYVADSSNNKIRKITLLTVRSYSVSSGVLDLSIRPDDTTCLLRFDEGTGQISLDTVDTAGSLIPGRVSGPYKGWTPRASATGLDSLTRVLWTNEDGSAALWLASASGNQASFRLGPVEGAAAVDVGAALPGSTHLLWTYADGRIAVWSVDNRGVVSTGSTYGPFPGWTAVAIADGQDGLSRVLWKKSDGSAGLWVLGPEGLATAARFGPVPGWTAGDIAVGADGLTRILWTHEDGWMATWSVDGAGNPRTLGRIYLPPPGFSAVRIAVGSDELTRVLWASANDGALLWVLPGE
jgi:sugar lactone lactonase YvrE